VALEPAIASVAVAVALAREANDYVAEAVKQHPTRFAALVPIAGGYVQGSRTIPPDICVLCRTPIWAFNGTADTIVYPYQPEILVQALRACGSG